MVMEAHVDRRRRLSRVDEDIADGMTQNARLPRRFRRAGYWRHYVIGDFHR